LPGGVMLRILDGVLHVRSPRRMLAYLSGERLPMSADGWLVTGDLVRVEGDRVLFCGRQDHVVNIAGLKVSPVEVESFLLVQPSVAEAQVYAIPNPITGSILGARVVLRSGAGRGGDAPRITRRVRSRFAAARGATATGCSRLGCSLEHWEKGIRNMRHVIVTGGSRGLGAETVRSLLEDGYFVSTCSRTKSEFIEGLERDASYSGKFYYQHLDLQQTDGYERFVDDCVARGGPLYALVNNAGIAMAGVLATFPNADSERILKVNLLGPLAMSRAIIRHFLRSRSGGRIVNISSIIGSRGYNGLAAYSASKAGLDGLTRALARELGPLRVTVNSIAPGYVRTEMSATLSQGQLDQIIRRTPLGRLAEPSDTTGALRFLLSDAAAFITGQLILVDGGVSASWLSS
jgi:3-oxoacyl-[acyl-carrier protein] reductase